VHEGGFALELLEAGAQAVHLAADAHHRGFEAAGRGQEMW
jgi:hypothetical protein